MRIPLNNLEEAYRDPGAYLRSKSSPQTGGFAYKSKYAVLKRAVYRYHKSGQDRNVAHRYLQESFLRQFKNQRDYQYYADLLDGYIDVSTTPDTKVIKVKDRLVVPLEQDLTDEFIVSGEIPRIDMTPDGFIVWLFSKEYSIPQNDPRLPVVQSAYAKKLLASEDEVQIGVYGFFPGTTSIYSFSEQELKEAEEALTSLLRQMVMLR